MEKADDLVIVLTTVPTKREALMIAKHLLAEKAAACTSFSDVTSVYKWKGELNESKEYQLVIKTTRKSFDKLEEIIKKYHSYSVPELLVIPIEKGGKSYLDWIHESCQ